MAISPTASLATGTAGRVCEQANGSAYFVWISTSEIRPDSEHDVTSGARSQKSKTKGFTNNTLDAVSFHSTTNFVMNANTEPVHAGGIQSIDQGETFTMQPLTPTINLLVLPFFPNQGAFRETSTIQNYADKRLRPLARRARITARPPRVLILSRKPCVLLRFKTLG